MREKTTDKKAKAALLTEHEFYDATGLEPKQRKKCEKERCMKPGKLSGEDKYYSGEGVSMAKILGRLTCAPDIQPNARSCNHGLPRGARLHSSLLERF